MLHPRIGSLNNPSRCYWNNSRFALGCFVSFSGLRSKLKANLGQDLRVKGLQCFRNGVGMITVVQQNGDFRNIDGFDAKVIQVVSKHLIGLRPAKGVQALVVSDICLCAMPKKR